MTMKTTREKTSYRRVARAVCAVPVSIQNRHSGERANDKKPLPAAERMPLTLSVIIRIIGFAF